MLVAILAASVFACQQLYYTAPYDDMGDSAMSDYYLEPEFSNSVIGLKNKEESLNVFESGLFLRKRRTGKWEDWQKLEDFSGPVAVVLNSRGLTELFIKDANAKLWRASEWVRGKYWGAPMMIEQGVELFQAIRGASGKMEIFYTGGSSLWHRWELTPGAEWSDKEQLDTKVRRFEVVRAADGHLEEFSIDQDGILWHKWELAPGGDWSDKERFDTKVNDFEVVRAADGRLEEFSSGEDSNLWHKWELTPGGNWSGKERLDTKVALVRAARNADGRLEIFTVGSDDKLRHKWELNPGGNWSSTELLSSIKFLRPQVVVYPSGRMEVFARAQKDQRLWWLSRSSPGLEGAWSAPSPLRFSPSLVSSAYAYQQCRYWADPWTPPRFLDTPCEAGYEVSDSFCTLGCPSGDLLHCDFDNTEHCVPVLGE